MPTMRALSARTLLLLAFSLALGAGCRFGIGNDYAVTVTWLINGTAPSPELCRAQGVDQIRFTVLGPGKERALYADCEEQVLLESDGFYYGGFVSTRSFEHDVRYRYRVEMIDRQGKVVQNAGYTDTFEVSWGDELPWVLVPLELFSPEGTLAGVRGEWTFERRKANAADCMALGAVTVAIDVASSTDPEFQDSFEIVRADCATGTVVSDGPALAEGEYYVRYVALDADDEVVEEVVIFDTGPNRDLPLLHVVDGGGTLRIAPIDFRL
jgi:hypothetical protein